MFLLCVWRRFFNVYGDVSSMCMEMFLQCVWRRFFNVYGDVSSMCIDGDVSPQLGALLFLIYIDDLPNISDNWNSFFLQMIPIYIMKLMILIQYKGL